MNLRRHLNVIVLSLLLLAGSVSCAPAPQGARALASFTESYVTVSITLEHGENGVTILSATFTPEKGHHLYSKDIPVNGLAGLGRPTLLELPEESQMTALGDLIESVQAQEADFEPKELLVYPAGPVILKLPVQLPSGNDWIGDEVRITYMACTAYQCKPPVEGKVVSIRIPGADMFDTQ